jgi:Ser/Thr protein kinase RdoA (MazF antagonist)
MTEREAVECMLNKYGVAPTEMLGRQMGYRNRSYPLRLADGRILNLIIYKSDADILERIRNAHRVAGHLAKRGLPVRTLADTRILTLRVSGRLKYAALYHYLPGATIPWEAYTRRHLKLLGATLSQVHAESAGLPQGNLPRTVDEYRLIIDKVFTYYSHLDVARAMINKLGLKPPLARLLRLERILAICEQFPHQQALHMDFVRGNILFSDATNGPEVTGILDFEKTAWGHPVFDIARTLAFLLVDSKYKSEYQIRKYFLKSGYNKRDAVAFRPPVIRIGDSHKVFLLEELVDLFLIYDLYKFMRHNPYESLDQNEHYLRTRDLLLSRRILVLAHRHVIISLR